MNTPLLVSTEWLAGRLGDPGIRIADVRWSLFEKDKATSFADVTDGLSNTIMVLESQEEVPWTRPEDLNFDPAAAPSLSGAGSLHPGGFNVLMTDGSVRFFKRTIDLQTFKSLITRAGGEILRADSF